jgi:hypothetical protein
MLPPPQPAAAVAADTKSNDGNHIAHQRVTNTFAMDIASSSQRSQRQLFQQKRLEVLTNDINERQRWSTN